MLEQDVEQVGHGIFCSPPGLIGEERSSCAVAKGTMVVRIRFSRFFIRVRLRAMGQQWLGSVGRCFSSMFMMVAVFQRGGGCGGVIAFTQSFVNDGGQFLSVGLQHFDMDVVSPEPCPVCSG